MWFWLKTKFALMMVALGVDWPNMADGDKLQAVVGTCIGIIGVAVGVMAFLVTRRQGQIAEKQNQYLEEQMSRKAALVVRLVVADSSRLEYFIAVTNSGTKTARDFYWQFMVPFCDDAQVQEHPGAPMRKEQDIVPHTADRYRKSSGYISTPLYPGRSMVCARLVVSEGHLAACRTQGDRVGLLPYLWAVTSEDGRFPPASWSEIELEPFDGPTHPEYKADLFQ